ncbi:RCC1 domain-containing protein [Cellulomonas humilata]|uniref:Uncharacterized protein n=1 Tax=Cellulomonas humilata TaxID=144055 RepID=A0ABU0ECN8_9CELL|nr:RCC1 domain-containing protein [Cellulomonas humilata]MDQ0373032.1 hypothetical protein [Cellulomonas humilata]
MDTVTRATVVRRRVAALSVAVLGGLLAVAALVPTATSSAWQDRVYADADVLILPNLVPNELDAGVGFTCALVVGDMWCWGEGGDGQLGVGTTADAGVPVSAGNGVTAMVVGTADSVNAGNGYACGASGGRAYCWGAGGGKLGDFNVAEPYLVPGSSVPTAVYDLPAGTGNQYQSPLYNQVVRDVVAGQDISCAVTEITAPANTPGACWGLQVGLTRPPSPAPQSWANAPITLPSIAQDPNSQLPAGVPISSLTSDFEDACFIAAGIDYCWGTNEQGQLGVGSVNVPYPYPVRVLQGAMPAGPVDAIAAGPFHTCAIAAAQVFCWGLASGGRLGIGFVPGAQTTPAAVIGLGGRSMVAVSAGDASTCALESTGQAWCWGSNSAGQLGTTQVPLFGSSEEPVAVQQPAGIRFTAISAGANHVCAIADDNIYCWGAAGTLGTGAGQVVAPVPSVPVTATWSTP